MKKNWKIYGVWIALSEGVGALSGLLTRRGMKLFMTAVAKPPMSPPGWVFPVVWGSLYALLGFGAARIWMAPDSRARTRGLNLFIVQLVVNFFWSLIFFNAQAFGFALIWLIFLWGLVLLMILQFQKVELLAARLQIPYLVWLTFAAYLNYGVWILNP